MLRWMLGNLLVWAVLFFGVPYAGVRFVPPEAGMMFTMALWLAVYPLYIALASHSAAQRKWNTLWLPLVHPALYALGVWLVFHTVPELAYCAGYLAVGYGFWGAGWGMKRRRQRLNLRSQALEQRPQPRLPGRERRARAQRRVDERGHVRSHLARALGDVGRARALLARELAFQQQVDVAAHHGERRHQIVRERGDKAD